MNFKYYREDISNPWSWYYTSEMLYENADALYGVYVRELEIERAEMRLMISNMGQDSPEIFNHPLHMPSCATIVPVFMMLMGMAIENIAKGIKVARKLKADPSIAEKASLETLGIRGHTGPELINELGIVMSDVEKFLLDDANEHLEWRGRYSAPANERKQILTNNIMDLTIAEAEEDGIFEVLLNLYTRLNNMFYGENSETDLDYGSDENNGCKKLIDRNKSDFWYLKLIKNS